MSRSAALTIMIFAIPAMALAGCGQGSSETVPSGRDASHPLVSVISVSKQTVTITDELPGRVAAFRTAEIRPQVGGIIEKRLFEQGAEVTAGQPLFQINPAPFKADVDVAEAALARTEANLVRAQGKFERAKVLLETRAISREAYDDTVADLAQGKANVAEAKAALQRRRLDLAFATIRAPISGRVGQALASEGALVAVSGTNPLAVVQQIDRVYVDVRQPSSQFDVIREATKAGSDDLSKIPVVIRSASGTPYPMKGRVLFSDISVDPGTGNVTVRTEVENPDRILLPGMYVRARLPRGIRQDVLLVPQEAIVRDVSGQSQLVIIDAAKKALRRSVTLGELVDGRNIVTSGLQPGETVVVQGQDRAPDGTIVDAQPFATVLEF